MARKLSRQLTLTEVEALLAMGCQETREFIILSKYNYQRCSGDLSGFVKVCGRGFTPDEVLRSLASANNKAYLIESSEGE